MNKLLFLTISLFMSLTISSTITCMDIHQAAMEGDLERVQALLNAGIQVDARDQWQYTPLHLAADNGHAEIALLLLENRAVVDTLDEGQETPLHWASECGNVDVARLLLKHGAAVDAQNNLRKTPFSMAAENSHVAIAQLLCKKRQFLAFLRASHSRLGEASPARVLDSTLLRIFIVA